MFKEINTKDISISDYTSILQRKEYICDTEDDIEDLPKRDKIAWGSTAKVISSSNIYILNSQNEWVILSSGGSNGGSESGGGSDNSQYIVVDTLPNIEDADPNKKYLRALCPSVFKAQGDSGFILTSLTLDKLPNDAEILEVPCVVTNFNGNAKLYGYDPSQGEIVEIPYSTTITTSREYDSSSADDPSITCISDMCSYYVFRVENGQWKKINISVYGK